MDVAASEFFKEGVYDLDFKNPASAPESKVTGVQLAQIYKQFCNDYPLVSIEDPFDQDDWDSYSAMTADIGAAC